jgi:hypothetical protein
MGAYELHRLTSYISSSVADVSLELGEAKDKLADLIFVAVHVERRKRIADKLEKAMNLIREAERLLHEAERDWIEDVKRKLGL